MLTTHDRDQFRAFIDTIGAAVYVVDVGRDGLFRYFAFNETQERDLGMTTAQVVGKLPHDLFDEAWADRLVANYRRCVAERAAITFRDYIEQQQGRRWSHHTLVPILDDSGRVWRLLGTAIECTEQRKAEEALAERLRFEHLVARLAAELVSAGADNLEAVLARVMGELGRFSGSDRLQVFEYDDDREHFSCTHEWVAEEITPVRAWYQHCPIDRFPWYRKMIEARQVMLNHEPRSVPSAQEQSEFARTGTKSSLILPLVSAGELLGALSNNTVRTATEWTEQTVGRFRLVAQLLADAIARASLERRLRRDRDYLRGELDRRWDASRIVGHDTGMKAVLEAARTVAPGTTTVLLTGETGTGKELVARAIHELSGRADAVLVTVNCAAISAGLVESELFGHVKGAFTGAVRAQPGRFELADGGTLFLDEIGELDLSVQAKLLRVLQSQCFERVGSNTTTHVDVRVIAATNRDLAAEVKAGHFRADLFYRLNVFPIALPPLRQRRQDIPALAEHFMRRHCRAQPRSLTPDAIQFLRQHDWPGNVRELANLLERAVILAEGPTVSRRDLAALLTPVSRVATLAEAQAELITSTLGRTHGVIEGESGAARLLGVSPSTLRSRMQKLGIARPE